MVPIELRMTMPLEKRPPEGAVSEGVSSPSSARGSVRYGTRFHRFSYSSSNFSMATAMLCWEDYQEEVVRLLIHNSATVRLSANSSCVSHYGQRICQTSLLQFPLLLYWVSATTDPETYHWYSGLDCVVDFRKQNCNIFQDIKASNFLRSINSSICFFSHRTHLLTE